MYTAQNGHNTPEEIEDLGTGSFHYNFNIVKTEDGHEYNQIRFDYPVNLDVIKSKTESLGFDYEEILNY